MSARHSAPLMRRLCPSMGKLTRSSALHLYHLMHGRHVTVEVIHDPKRAPNEQRNDQHPESQRKHVIGVVRSSGDVQKENEMHANLRDSERDQRNRNGRPPDQVGVQHVERGHSKHGRKRKADEIALNPLPDAAVRSVHEPGANVAAAAVVVGHRPSPIRYTIVNSATQMISSACQKRLKQINRRRMLGRKPFTKTCAIMVPSHSNPAVTCSPWQPTTAKNEDKKALRWGPAPCATMRAKSRASSTMKQRPRRPVTSRQICVQSWLRASVATADNPQVKLEASRHTVSMAMLQGLKRSRPEGPPAVAVCSTACAAKKAENITMSLSRKIQKPNPTITRAE